MNIYDVYLNNHGGVSGNQTIVAPNPSEAIQAFLRTADGGVALEKSTGAELRVFRRNEGVVMQSKFETPIVMTPDNGVAAGQPPAAQQPEPSKEKPGFDFNGAMALGSFVMGAIAASLSNSKPQPVAKKKSRKK